MNINASTNPDRAEVEIQTINETAVIKVNVGHGEMTVRVEFHHGQPCIYVDTDDEASDSNFDPHVFLHGMSAG